jgi:hypothetical protein
MQTTINGHLVEFYVDHYGSMDQCRGYWLRIDGLLHSRFNSFSSAEEEARTLCEKYPAADLGHVEEKNASKLSPQ